MAAITRGARGGVTAVAPTAAVAFALAEAAAPPLPPLPPLPTTAAMAAVAAVPGGGVRTGTPLENGSGEALPPEPPSPPLPKHPPRLPPLPPAVAGEISAAVAMPNTASAAVAAVSAVTEEEAAGFLRRHRASGNRHGRRRRRCRRKRRRHHRPGPGRRRRRCRTGCRRLDPVQHAVTDQRPAGADQAEKGPGRREQAETRCGRGVRPQRRGRLASVDHRDQPMRSAGGCLARTRGSDSIACAAVGRRRGGRYRDRQDRRGDVIARGQRSDARVQAVGGGNGGQRDADANNVPRTARISTYADGGDSACAVVPAALTTTAQTVPVMSFLAV